MWSAIIITRDIYVKSSDYLCELIPGLSGYDCINSVVPCPPLVYLYIIAKVESLLANVVKKNSVSFVLI